MDPATLEMLMKVIGGGGGSAGGGGPMGTAAEPWNPASKLAGGMPPPRAAGTPEEDPYKPKTTAGQIGMAIAPGAYAGKGGSSA